MAYEQDVKELAYTIDPLCWVSYSGKPRLFKAFMEERRVASLKKAQETADRIRNKHKRLSVDEQIADLERKIADLRSQL